MPADRPRFAAIAARGRRLKTVGRIEALKEESETQAARAEAVNIARRVLGGEVSILVAARELVGLRFAASDERDPDFLTFVAIDSETDHLPIGQEREYWAPDALAEKDVEIAKVEEWAREIGAAACKRLIERFDCRS